MRRFGWVVFALAFSMLAAAWAVPAAYADKRIALLIGNQGYGSEIGQLGNPHNDIALLEKALQDLRFEVTTVRDAGLAALHQAVNAYARRVRVAGPGAVAFFYYSGHGASDAVTNYLIPVDVKSVEDTQLWDQSLRLTEITRKLRGEAGNATHFVVFDACRNTLKLNKPGSRALVQSKGFVSVSQEPGMLIAYATAEGELASDVGAGVGPYAKVLAEEIIKPGVEAVVMFRIVQRRVRDTIKQEPYLGFNALGDVYLAGLEPPRPPPAAAAPSSAAQPQISEAEFADKAEWAIASATDRLVSYRVYLRSRPDGLFASEANLRIAYLERFAARWDELKAGRNLTGLSSFAEQAKSTEFGTAAADRLKELSSQEAAAWQEAVSKQRLKLYEDFLAIWQAGLFAEQAKQRISGPSHRQRSLERTQEFRQ